MSFYLFLATLWIYGINVKARVRDPARNLHETEIDVEGTENASNENSIAIGETFLRSEVCHEVMEQEDVNKGIVCGVNGVTYDCEASANADGQTIMHCGPCGQCSTKHDITIYWNTQETLTHKTTECAYKSFLSEYVVSKCMKRVFGWTDACHSCWMENIRCTYEKCTKTCLLWKFFRVGDHAGLLDPCLACDERECGQAFQDCAGANRRRSGIETDINRPAKEMCSIFDPSFPDIN